MVDAASLRKRAWWLRGVANHLSDRDVAELLCSYADQMTGEAIILETEQPELDAIRHRWWRGARAQRD